MDENLVIFLIVFICLIGGLFTFAIKMSEKECSSKATAIGYKYEFGVFQGCVLEKPNGQKILLEQLRYNENY